MFFTIIFTLFSYLLVGATIFFLSDIIYTWACWKSEKSSIGTEKYSYITLADLEKLLLLPNLKSSYLGITSANYEVFGERIREEPRIKITGISSCLSIEYIPQREGNRINLLFKSFFVAYFAKYLVKIRRIQLKSKEEQEKFIPFDQLIKK